MEKSRQSRSSSQAVYVGISPLYFEVLINAFYPKGSLSFVIFLFCAHLLLPRVTLFDARNPGVKSNQLAPESEKEKSFSMSAQDHVPPSPLRTQEQPSVERPRQPEAEEESEDAPPTGRRQSARVRANEDGQQYEPPSHRASAGKRGRAQSIQPQPAIIALQGAPARLRSKKAGKRGKAPFA